MEPSNLYSQRGNADTGMPDAFQRGKDVLPQRDVLHAVQRQSMERLAADAEHLHSRSGDMHPDNGNTDPKLPSGVHRFHNTNPDGNMPRSLWQPLVRAVDDYFRHLREIGHKPDQSDKPSQPAQPIIASESHRCERHNERHCNCSGSSCADDDCGDPYEQLRQQRDLERNYNGPRLRTPEPNHLGNFRCPISGLACDKLACREWCEGSSSGTTARTDWRSTKAANYYRNIDSETGAT